MTGTEILHVSLLDNSFSGKILYRLYRFLWCVCLPGKDVKGKYYSRRLNVQFSHLTHRRIKKANTLLKLQFLKSKQLEPCRKRLLQSLFSIHEQKINSNLFVLASTSICYNQWKINEIQWSIFSLTWTTEAEKRKFLPSNDNFTPYGYFFLETMDTFKTCR